MAEKTGKIYIKWVRSGIGFPRQQKDRVKSLGLRRLNQVVERPDTAHIRGLVASVPHLVKVVDPPASPAWSHTPEYKIAEARSTIAVNAERPAEGPRPEKPVPDEKAAEPATATLKEMAAPASEAKAARPKKARAVKTRSSESGEETPAEVEKPKRQRKAAKPKSETKE